MVVCRFYQKGQCKFGEKCKNEHPGQTAGPPPQQRDVYAAPNRGPSNRYEPLENRMSNFGGGNEPARGGFGGGRGGFVGGGSGRGERHVDSYAPPGPQQRPRAGGFQPRDQNRDRRNDVTHHRDAFGLSAAGMEAELRDGRPTWIMSCYGPGDNPGVQLFGGHPLEQSPEELRTAHYLAVANGSPEASAQLEQELAALSNQQVENVLNDIHGAIDYVIAGSKQHPNRLDEIKDIDRSIRQGHFSVQNYRQRRGAFQARQRPSQDPRSQSGSRQPSGFSQPRQPESFPTNNAFATNNASNPGYNAPPFGTQQPTSQFGQQPPFALGNSLDNQQQPQAGFNTGTSAFGNNFGQPQQPTPNGFGQPQHSSTNGFGQASSGQPISQFAQAQSTAPFGQQQQQQQQQAMGGFPGSPMDSNAPTNNFGGQPVNGVNNPALNSQAQPAANAFGTDSSQPSGFQGYPTASNGYTLQSNMVNGMASSAPGGVGYVINGVSNGGMGNNSIPGNATSNGAMVNGNTRPGGNDLQEAYAYMMQHGHFKDGIMPETAPDPMWIQ